MTALTEVNNFFGEEAAEAKLYDDSILLGVDFAAYNFKSAISVSDPGPGLKIRALSSGDYDRGEVTQDFLCTNMIMDIIAILM
jgi:hypothetical protein